MITQPFSETTERIQKAFKETSELFTKTTASLMDSYSKQMNTGYDFYKKLAETAKYDGKTTWTDRIKESTASSEKAINSTLNLSKEMMEKIFSEFSEKEWIPISKQRSDAILTIFKKQAEQSLEFGKQFLQAMQQKEILSPETLRKQSVRFNELMRESIKSSENAISEMIASNNEKASYTEEVVKKLMKNIQNQLNELDKIHVKFTEDIMSTVKEKETPSDKILLNKPILVPTIAE